MIKENLEIVEANIQSACKRAGRDRSEVTLIAVSKTKPVSDIREAMACGIKVFGENKVQEIRDKTAEIKEPLSWHMIGHLQANKVKYLPGVACMIHSVDTPHLAKALDKEAGKIGKVQDILVQVNLAKEDSKSGVYKEDLRAMLDLVETLPHLCLRGLMCIAPNYEDVELCRPLFREMHEIYQQVKELPYPTANITYLSMGMTHDYPIAVEEGANIVRVGTAIFGPRQY